MKKSDLTGKRVRLIEMDDEFTDLTENSLGTITGEDDMGNIHVRWDNGSTLSLIPDVDKYEIVSESKKFKYLKMFEDFEADLAHGLEVKEPKPNKETEEIRRKYPNVEASIEEYEKSEYFSPEDYNSGWNLYLSSKATKE
jgi:hypothetical protein